MIPNRTVEERLNSDGDPWLELIEMIQDFKEALIRFETLSPEERMWAGWWFYMLGRALSGETFRGLLDDAKSRSPASFEAFVRFQEQRSEEEMIASGAMAVAE